MYSTARGGAKHTALISVIKMFYFTFYRNCLKEEIKEHLRQSLFFTGECSGVLQRRGDDQAVEVHRETRKIIKLI